MQSVRSAPVVRLHLPVAARRAVPAALVLVGTVLAVATLAIGVPLERVGVADDAGAVSVIYGSTVGLSATATPDQLWHQNRPFVEDSCEEDDHAGAAVAAFG